MTTRRIIEDFEKNLEEIFALEREIQDKDNQIAILKFELSLQKQLYENIKKTSLKFLGWSL